MSNILDSVSNILDILVNKMNGKTNINLETYKSSIANQLAIGVSQGAIAAQVGVSQPTISRFANDEEVQELIKEQQVNLAMVVPDAVGNIKKLVSEMNDSGKDIEEKKLAYKATQDVLKSVSVLASPQFANNIYNDNRKTNTVVDGNVLKMLQSSGAMFEVEAEVDNEADK